MAAKTKPRKKTRSSHGPASNTKEVRSLARDPASIAGGSSCHGRSFEVPDSVTKSDWDVVNRSASGWCVEGWGLRWICCSRETAVKVQALLAQIEDMPDRVDVENLDQGQG
jgi:hypothetical protein